MTFTLDAHVAAVLEAARGRGIASVLIQRSLAAARADGCTSCTWTPTLSRHREVYERLGFAALNTSVSMIKQLADS